MADFSNSNVDSVILARDSTVDQGDEDPSELRFIVVGQRCRENVELKDSFHVIGESVIYSDTGLEYLNEAGDYETVFVLPAFTGDIFHRLHKAGARIIGPPVIIKCARENQRLPNNTRPLFCTAMRHLVICFTGIRVKEDLSTLAELVHHMGGSIRKDFSTRVTHLVANCTSGEKYRAAVSFGTDIMKEEWVHQCWKRCHDVDLSATDPNLMDYKMSPFSILTISFLGFSRSEELHMEELTVRNGGTYAEAGAPTSTHLVVDETNVKNIPFDVRHKLHVVKTEWFWASIQMDACADESMYRFEEATETPNTASASSRSSCTTPKTLSGGKGRKRKRLRDNLRELAAEVDVDSPFLANKRRSNELARMSLSASFLEVTDPSLKSPESAARTDGGASPPPADISKMSPRQLTVMELLQTEKNYVGILHTILKVFKEEIERTDQPGGPILEPTDTKIIFGGVGPIYDAHVGLRDDIQAVLNNWHNDQSIGMIFVNHAEALLKAYPPFVNFFENTKETITRCDKTKPRFHAFLKVCQTKPECGRQTLAELLIRPVQRLPSIMLLLKEIQKRTDKSQADHTQLSEAIAKLEEVMTHINEDKRKAEGHQLMFDIINDIDNCPPNLLSSHRNFVLKVDVVEVTDTLSGKGDHLSLFLFTDSVEMCKRRLKVLNAKSPAASHAPKTPQKAYKHLEMMQLSNIKKVVNINETKECKGVFALVTKELNKKEKLYAFMLADDDVDKNELLRNLSKHISNTTCRADFENLMASLDASSLQLDVVDLQQKTLSKAATKFGKRVSRAFSFNKTPRKLKRAMSSMSQVMSPFRRDSMGGFVNPNNAQTPSNLRGMRLASTNDLTPQEEEEESFYSSIVDSHSIFNQSNASFATPKKRRETLAVSRLPGVAIMQVAPPGVLSPHLSGLSHAASCLTLHRVDSSASIASLNKSRLGKMKAGRRKSVAWREASSPLFAAPSTPNLALQFNKSATIGTAAGKFL